VAKKASSPKSRSGKKTGVSRSKSAKKTTKKTPKKPVTKKAINAERKVRRLKKTPLGKRELAEFREILLAKRRDMVGDMNDMEASALRTGEQSNAGDLSTMPDHPANIATDNYEQEFTLELLESERVMLAEIDEALERIENRTYGICLGTGQAIGKARLQARPWAKYCIEYARMLEKGLVSHEKDIDETNEPDEED